MAGVVMLETMGPKVVGCHLTCSDTTARYLVKLGKAAPIDKTIRKTDCKVQPLPLLSFDKV